MQVQIALKLVTFLACVINFYCRTQFDACRTVNMGLKTTKPHLFLKTCLVSENTKVSD